MAADRAPGPPAGPLLIVDLSRRTGPVRHGAHGMLYGLSDPGVPSDELLAPLRMAVTAAKAPGGRQHPNGDALAVAPGFVRAGGRDVHVYVQDDYPHWPYDDLGLADYLPRVERIARAVADHPLRAHFVLVPFNEPDWIWYGLREEDPADREKALDRLLDDWVTVVGVIRAAEPAARVAGLNLERYDGAVMSDFLAHAARTGTLPDVVTWHELPTGNLATYRGHLTDYRDRERAAGIGPLPVNVNEYGGRRDLSVPGRLVQWLTLFEDTKVDAGGQAYWDVAGTLAGSACQTNRPTGSWWLLKMYADLSGETVEVTPPRRDAVDTLQGLASLDTRTRQVHVVLGGGSGDGGVLVHGLSPDLFGRVVHATLARTDWSGYDADAPPPAVLLETDLDVGPAGTVRIPIAAMDPLAAYEVVLSPGGVGRRPWTPPNWRGRYEAEDGEIAGGEIRVQGTPEDYNRYAASGDRDVGGLAAPGSSLSLAVDVPATADYTVSVRYGTGGGRERQLLGVDEGDPVPVDYPATLNEGYWSRVDLPLRLAAGPHRLTFAADPDAPGTLALDRVDLAPAGTRAERYPAERARAVGPVRHAYDDPDQSGAGHVILAPGGSLTFVVGVPADGYHSASIRYAAGVGTAAPLSLDGAELAGAELSGLGLVADPAVAGWTDHTETLFLCAGVHRIGARNDGPGEVRLDVLTVAPAPPGTAIPAIQAQDPRVLRIGSAVLWPHPAASGGVAVTSAGGPGGLLVPVPANGPGRYTLVLHYSNADRATGHEYNADVISRPLDVAVGDRPPVRVWLRNTWSQDNIWSVSVPLELRARDEVIALRWSDEPVPLLDRFVVARVRLADPSDDS